MSSQDRSRPDTRTVAEMLDDGMTKTQVAEAISRELDRPMAEARQIVAILTTDGPQPNGTTWIDCQVRG